MKCLSCDVVLSDKEATRRYKESKQFVDLCDDCLEMIPNFPDTIVRSDLEGDDSSIYEDTVV